MDFGDDPLRWWPRLTREEFLTTIKIAELDEHKWNGKFERNSEA
jgi:hypothetical protein